MKDASVGTITADWRYDLNVNGLLADSDVDDDESDLSLMKKASAGAIELV